jgi:hypothetical protein
VKSGDVYVYSRKNKAARNFRQRYGESFYEMEEWEGNAENDFMRRFIVSSRYFSLSA